MSSQTYWDFLDILLTAKDDDGNSMSKEDMLSEVDTFLFAGMFVVNDIKNYFGFYFLRQLEKNTQMSWLAVKRIMIIRVIM